MSETYEQLKLENQVCFPLYACARRIVNLYNPLLKPLGLTYTQYIVFMVLWEAKSATVGEIGKRLFLDEGTLTPLLKKMADKGYVTRERLKEDERVTKVTITKAGEDMKEECKDIPGEVAKCIYSLDEKESLELYGLLYKLLENKKD